MHIYRIENDKVDQLLKVVDLFSISMTEIEDIIASFKTAQSANKKMALATVVHVQGSSYRRPGARMLVTEDGELTGAISGGCLEGDALRKALLAITQQQNKLVTYDSMDEEDNNIGIQLGCNGIVHILFEPVDASQQHNPIALLQQLVQQTSAAVLVTLFSLHSSSEQPGTCLLTAGSKRFGAIKEPLPEQQIVKDSVTALARRQSMIKDYALADDKNITAFIELVEPPVDLVVAGAGNDVFPLVQIASLLGWHVTVVDGRKTHANAKRFPNVKKLIVAKPPEVMQELTIYEHTVVVLMSHNYNYDIALLRHLLQANCNYIGLLGPKAKLSKMLDELAEEGIKVSAEQKEKIYGPVGLDIGAETAAEIAVAVVAEIKAVLSKRSGATLRSKPGFIHEHHDLVKPIGELV